MSGMERREFVALLGGAAAWPVTVQAQQSERVRQIGVLMGTLESDLDQKGMVSTFTRALADLGWMEGTNIRIEKRWAEGNFARLRTHALDLARHAAQVAPSRRGGRPAERSGGPARTWTMSRKTWQICIETQMRLSCNRDVFLLQGNLRAREGANEICHRGWDRSIPRDLL